MKKQKTTALVAFRNAFGFTQKQIAEYAGVTRTFIAQIEAKEREVSIKVSNILKPLLEYYFHNPDPVVPDPRHPKDPRQIKGICEALDKRILGLENQVYKTEKRYLKMEQSLGTLQHRQGFCEMLRGLGQKAMLWALSLGTESEERLKSVNEKELYLLWLRLEDLKDALTRAEGERDKIRAL